MREAGSSEINRIFCEVLERQAFLFADPLDVADFEAAEGAHLLSSMTFGGETPGSLSLVAGEAVAREIAANFLGTNTEDPSVEANYRDALNEILNVVCGHLLTALNGDHAIHDLSIPSLRELTSLEAAEMAQRPGCLAFSVEEHHALLFVDFFPVSGGKADEGGTARGAARG
jgi:CheY-specific phosphatase CheX